jgi:ferric-dicitrate binding protein FerR (iron transport regulator)
VASGEATEVRHGLTLPTLKLGNADDVTRWMRRFLAFQSTDLGTVATEIERVYGTRVAFADPSLESETVTAAFTDESLEQVTRVLCAVVGVQCAVTDSLITISR